MSGGSEPVVRGAAVLGMAAGTFTGAARRARRAAALGVRALLAHALDQTAADFHARYDFQPSPTDPLHMVLLLKDARALLRTIP